MYKYCGAPRASASPLLWHGTSGFALITPKLPPSPPQSPAASLAGFIAGVALQILQPELWPQPVYAALMVAALLLWLVKTRFGNSAAMALLLAGALGFGMTGWRATAFVATALAPALEA